MDEEWFEVGAEAAAALRAARARAAGASSRSAPPSVRALESACDAQRRRARAPRAGWTRKFILPPYAFRAVDALLTNFHLPRTTLLLLVAAFAGEELLRAAYAHAVRGALPLLLLRGRDAGGVGRSGAERGQPNERTARGSALRRGPHVTACLERGLPCFLYGRTCRLLRSISSAAISRGRVSCGSITSSR